MVRAIVYKSFLLMLMIFSLVSIWEEDAMKTLLLGVVAAKENSQ